MFSYIEKIRQKSEPERKRIALLISAAITASIFTVWMVTVFSTNDSGNQNQNIVKEKEDQIASPLESIKYQFEVVVDWFKDIKN